MFDTVKNIHVSLQQLGSQYCRFLNFETNIKSLKSSNINLYKQVEQMKKEIASKSNQSDIDVLRTESETMNNRDTRLKLTVTSKGENICELGESRNELC